LLQQCEIAVARQDRQVFGKNLTFIEENHNY
jgi:hypothetical protein